MVSKMNHILIIETNRVMENRVPSNEIVDDFGRELMLVINAAA